MLLRDIAHLRTGDKGDISQISVIAYAAEGYEMLVRCVTRARVLDHLNGVSVRAFHRYEIPDLYALNLVLEGALAGGVTRSLSLDAHGKTLGAQLLDMTVE